MGRRGAPRFPPRRLAALSDAQLRWMRLLWVVALVTAIAFDIAGTVFALRDAYERDPVFTRFGLVSEYEDDGTVLVEAMPGYSAGPAIAVGSRIVAIDGEPVARTTKVWDLADRLAAPERRAVALTVLDPGGERRIHRLVPDDGLAARAEALAPIPRDLRIGLRLVTSLVTCFALIGCAVLLFMRRPRDPVALLFSFSFLLFAATIDPPLLMWSALGWGDFFDLYSVLAWLLLVIGIAVFPDGKFNPRPVRWVLVVAPIAAIPLCFDSLSLALTAVIAFLLPLSLLASHVIKYRRFEPGIERQQIKWAGFGFATGLILLALAFIVAAAMPASSTAQAFYGLAVVGLFNAGFLAMAIGLLVSLIRFRLWEADKVISRSVVSAGVTVAVGVVWTLSLDLVKAAVEFTLGEANIAVATAASAVLAAGLFAPTQALALRWTKRRFDHENDRISKLIARLAVWRTAETPEEIGTRSLSALAAAVHCSSAAILIDTPHGRSVVASRDLEDAGQLTETGRDAVKDRRFVQALPLEDDDGPIGHLLLGPRSDFNRYNSGQLQAMRDVTEPLAEALRTAVKRVQHAESVHRLIGSVEERLNRLEGGRAGLSPT